MKTLHTSLIAIFVSLSGLTAPVVADDTEIYLRSNEDAGQPMIMLVLDYRPNLSAVECAGYSELEGRVPDKTSECGDLFYEAVCGEIVYPERATPEQISETDTAHEAACRTGIEAGLAEEDDYKRVIFLPDDPGSVIFFELLRTALFVVLDPLQGFRIGLMMYHDDEATRNTFDPSANTQARGICANNAQGKCSNGGYILLGFNGDSQDAQYPYDPDALVKWGDLTGLYGGNADGEYDLEDHKIRLHEILAAIPPAQGNRAHEFQGKELQFEFFRYLTGQDVFNGHMGYRDFDNADDDLNLNEEADQRAYMWDRLIEQDHTTLAENDPTLTYTYRSPIYESCARIFVVNHMFTTSRQQESNADQAIDGSTGDADYDAQSMTEIDISGNNNNLTTVLKWLNKETNTVDRDLADGTSYGGAVPDLDGEQNVTQYFLVEQSKVQSATDMAIAGDYPSGRPRVIGADRIKDEFENIFNEILNISTTFVSATVPVNVYNRSESLDNVFFGIFQPEKRKQWKGNVKRLQMHVITEEDVVAGNPNNYIPDTIDPNTQEVIRGDVGKLAVWDANGIEAITRPLGDDPGGRIKSDALTFWTNANGHDVQQADLEKGETVGTDGRSVNRGGAGQKIHDFLNLAVSSTNGPRYLYTEDEALNETLLAIESSNIESFFDAVKESLGLDSVTDYSDLTNDVPDPEVIGDGNDINRNGIGDEDDVNNLLKFIRGIDVNDQDGDGNITESRPWLFGDILHVQPTPVNYGFTGNGYNEPVAPDTQGNPEIYMLTAGNDGFVRMIRNNTNSTNATTRHQDAGDEVWAFMPREILPGQVELSENAEGTHPYGVDGQLSVYIYDHNNDDVIDDFTNDKVWAFFGLRRGGQDYGFADNDLGKVYYGLDITNPDPSSQAPKLIWKIKKQPNPGDDFYELGQTWSRPIIRLLDWDGDGVSDPRPVLIFGGGYDAKKDNDSNIVDGYDANGNGDLTDPGDSTNADYIDTEGNAIFIVDAETGALVWKAVRGPANESTATVRKHPSLNDSIPTNVMAVYGVPDEDVIVDRLYVGDTGGVLWRVDLPTDLDSDNRGDWTLEPILSAGRHATDQPDRRFFHRPDAVFSSDTNGAFTGVLIGSGDRPNAKSAIHTDQFYMVKDRIPDVNFTRQKTIGIMNNNTDCTADDLEFDSATETAADYIADLVSCNGSADENE